MPQKRLNRKKIIETLEIARQGYDSMILYSLQNDDMLTAKCCKSHHDRLNKIIVELGGEDVSKNGCWIKSYIKHNFIK